MKLAFKPVLRLEIWHDYYLDAVNGIETLPAQYDIAEAITLVPTPDCQRILRNLRWLVRMQPYGAVILAQVDSTTPELTPVVPVDAATRLTFWLVVRDRNFANYTNLPLTISGNPIYYFSNRSGNQVDDRLFLTQPLLPYKAGTRYPLGQLVSYRQGAKTVTLEATQYQAIASKTPQLIPRASPDNGSAGTSASPTAPVGEWMPLPYSQYVSASDALPRQGWFYKTSLPQVTAGTSLLFSLVNINRQTTAAQSVQVPADHPAGIPLPVNLNFSGQQPGYYQLLLNGKLLDAFVLFDPMAGRDAFGLVELSLSAAVVPAAFQLLDGAAGQLRLRPKTYTLRFKNRATRWRYRCDRPHGFTPDHLPNDLQILDAQTYATRYPIGLCRQPRRLLTDGNRKLLPAPGVALINPLIESAPDGSQTVTAFFSDTYL